jgi:uncharacterized protein
MEAEAGLEAVIALLERSPAVKLAYVFGSVAAGRARPDSDLDLALHASPALTLDDELELRGALDEAAGRRVDLVLLEGAPPLLAREAIAHGRVVLCRDPALRAELEARIVARYLDTAHLRRVQDAYLALRARAGDGRPT